ncbi:MAG: hypothetical protein M3082_00960 [Candidatus Dormibacteraeota bacterium]|nr:hypothetical protein [Candidatus Dormibacteraeota bacterium]
MIVTLTDDPDSGDVRIVFGFNSEAIRRLKALGGCWWDPDQRCWWTSAARRDAVAAVFRSLGYEVIGDVRRRREPEPAPRALFANPAEAYLRSLPARLQPIVFRSLALILHPDVDGDHRAMVELNLAWNQLKDAA